MTPLVAVIKQGDLRSVRVLLAMKASPSISWLEQGHPILPLEEAVWLGHEKISRLLLENGVSEMKGWCHGVLHGAIAKKMFTLVKLLMEKGASLDSTYVGRKLSVLLLRVVPKEQVTFAWFVSFQMQRLI